MNNYYSVVTTVVGNQQTFSEVVFCERGRISKLRTACEFILRNIVRSNMSGNRAVVSPVRRPSSKVKFAKCTCS